LSYTLIGCLRQPTVVEIAGTVRHFKSPDPGSQRQPCSAHVFEQQQGVLTGDIAAGMTEPERSQIVGTSCLLELGGAKSGKTMCCWRT